MAPSKKQKRTTFDDFPEIRELEEKKTEIRERILNQERELEEVLDGVRSGGPGVSRDDRARAILEGNESDGVPSDSVVGAKKRAAQLMEQIQLFRRAESMCAGAIRDAELEASRTICENLRGEFSEDWGEFAQLLVKVSEKATSLMAKYDDLSDEGVSFSGDLPVSIPLGRWDARDENSRINLAVSEIETDWGIVVERPALEAAEAQREEWHLKLEERKQAAAAKRERERQESIKRGRKAHEKFLSGLGFRQAKGA